ncbi:hypothetical protein GCM10023340_28130 [Nocardioides marinquilinus]|jgi:hypothetical protein|uniref:Uncharacterized protein n=1 Tax=Nocardioides marinquilinus TaxID=1210400 RepID=A0ABP9PVS6_9ACTN
MYDMYPEWGPAKNRTEQHDPRLSSAVQTALDLRDSTDRPDDN